MTFTSPDRSVARFASQSARQYGTTAASSAPTRSRAIDQRLSPAVTTWVDGAVDGAVGGAADGAVEGAGGVDAGSGTGRATGAVDETGVVVAGVTIAVGARPS